MSSNSRPNVPFLRQQRKFPQESQPLAVEIDRAYTDIANSMNVRVLGTFTSNVPIQSGETWYLNGIGYTGFRQLYTFTAAGNINHGIDTSAIFAFTKIYGTFTDGTNWYPLPYVATPSSNNQIELYVTPTDIVINSGPGTPPTISQGYVVLEYIANS